MYDIFVIGSATREVFLQSKAFTARNDASSETGQVEVFPLGSKIEVDKIAFASGGAGTNTAVTFARQGFKTVCVGVIGNDISGHEILRELEAEGVNVDHFQKHKDDYSAYSVVLVDKSGERTILTYKGEVRHFDANKIHFDKLVAGWCYIDSLGGHFDVLEKTIAHCKKNKIKIAYNPGGKELAFGLEKLKPQLEQVDVLFVNKNEGEGLLNQSGNSKQVANELQKITKGIVSVSDGPRGVVVVDHEGSTYTAGIPDSPVIERTGAGDAFGSGFVSQIMINDKVQMSNDEKIIRAIQYGTANASSVVTQFGAKAGILKKGDNGEWPMVEVKKI